MAAPADNLDVHAVPQEVGEGSNHASGHRRQLEQGENASKGGRIYIEAWILGGLMLGAMIEALIGAAEQVASWF